MNTRFPHESQAVYELREPHWGFDDKGPFYHLNHDGGWGVQEFVDPAPCYAHNLALVESEFEYLRKRAPITIPLGVCVLHREPTGRTNGWYTNTCRYDENDKYHKIGLIGLAGKRIPIHPAMTRYLVAHEYGHAVEDELAVIRGLKNDQELLKLYQQDVRPDATFDYGPGKWHTNVGELFANDFRIVLAFRESEFWPHPGFTHPSDDKKVIQFWRQAQLDLIGWKNDLPPKYLPLHPERNCQNCCDGHCQGHEKQSEQSE